MFVAHGPDPLRLRARRLYCHLSGPLLVGQGILPGASSINSLSPMHYDLFIN